MTDEPPKQIDFTTYTTRYADAAWITIAGLQEHWKASDVRAQIDSSKQITIETNGVTHLELDFQKYAWPREAGPVAVMINGQSITVQDDLPQAGLQCRLVIGEAGTADRKKLWKQQVPRINSIRKRPGLQGPIDDAFCDAFLFVLPSGKSNNPIVQEWIEDEIEYAQDRWRRLMRGEVRAVLDSDLTEDQIEANNLICFGDWESNSYLRAIASQLPITWHDNQIQVGPQTFDGSYHVPVMCYPNPNSSTRYVVVNSGMTFREFSNVSNSRQIAMLPDWAVIDCREQDKSIFPGKVVARGFFNEQWMLK